MQYLGPNYAKKLFIVYLKLKFHWASYFILPLDSQRAPQISLLPLAPCPFGSVVHDSA